MTLAAAGRACPYSSTHGLQEGQGGGGGRVSSEGEQSEGVDHVLLAQPPALGGNWRFESRPVGSMRGSGVVKLGVEIHTSCLLGVSEFPCELGLSCPGGGSP